MSNNELEPKLRNMNEAMTMIRVVYGPRRYQDDGWKTNVTGACANIEPSFAYADAETIDEELKHDPFHGDGTVYGWFVGSPRVFLFGFTKTEAQAISKMNETMKSEYFDLTGKILEIPNRRKSRRPN